VAAALKSLNLAKIHWILILVFVGLIPVSQFLCVRVIFLTLLVTPFVWNDGHKRLFYRSWDLWLYLAILVIGLLYSGNVKAGLRELETSFSFIAIPIIFSAIERIDDNRILNIFQVFMAGLLITCVISLTYASYNYLETGDTSHFFYYELTNLMNSHPTYLAYYLIFGITVCLYTFYYNRTNVIKVLPVVMIVVFFFVLILTGGSTALISLILVFSFFILKFIVEPRTSSKTVIFSSIIVMTVLLFVASRSGYLMVEGDYWKRSGLWASALDANSNPLIGVGTGYDREVLNDYYIKHGLTHFAEENYNSHNQFIEVYLSNGILGLIVLILMIVRPMYLSMRNDNPLAILCLFPFIVYGMNEVFLGRYQGVVFFVLLHQLFVIWYKGLKPEVFLKPAEGSVPV